MAIVYQHRRKDTGEVFYIGIGRDRKRAYKKEHRNSHWHNIVNKTGYEIDILIEGCTWEEACEIEKGMISDYGRHDLKQGCLSNQTDGGDGGNGMVVSKEAREKIRQFQISLNKKGKPGRKQSDEVKEKIRKTLTGRSRPEEVKNKIRKPKSNKENYKKPKNKIECPHCGLMSQPSLAYRWHFDNCRSKNRL